MVQDKVSVASPELAWLSVIGGLHMDFLNGVNGFHALLESYATPALHNKTTVQTYCFQSY